MKATRTVLAAALVALTACEQGSDPTGMAPRVDRSFSVVPALQQVRRVTVCKDAPNTGSFLYTLSGLSGFTASVSSPFGLTGGQCTDIGIAGGSGTTRGSVTVNEAPTAGFNQDSVQVYEVISDIDGISKVPVYSSTSTTLPLSVTVQPGRDAVGFRYGYVLVFFNSEAPPPPEGCTFTLGYWKNHPSAWPVTSLTLGTVTYTQAQLISILKQPVKGNGLVQLAHQLIAAKLNVAAGAGSGSIASAITAADALIGGLVVPPIGSGSLPTGSPLVSQLDNFNNGFTGPGHCGNSDI